METEDFLKLAGELIAEETEAAWRTAVSRSYYAAFHVGRRLLSIFGFAVPRGPAAHGFVASRLIGAGQIDIRQAAESLQDLRRYRNWADYDLDRPLRQIDAVAQYTRAERIVHVLNAARDESFRKRVTDAIRRYEHEILEEDTWHSD